MKDIIFQLQYFITDNLSWFSPKDIPAFIINIFIVILLTSILKILFSKRLKRKNKIINYSTVIALVSMLLAITLKFSLSLSVGLIAILLILRPKKIINNFNDFICLLLSIVIGLTCGAGFSILTIIIFLFIFSIIFINTFIKKKESFILKIQDNNNSISNLSNFSNKLSKYTESLILKKYTEYNNIKKIHYKLTISNIDELEKIINCIKRDFPNLKFSYTNNF